MHNTETRIQELETELDTALSASTIRDLQTELDGLEKQLNDWQGNYTGLLNFLEGGDSPNQLSIIEPAQLPTNPISPNVQMNVMLAAAAGFALAFAAAILLEYIDDTVKTKGDLGKTSGLTILGGINRLSSEGSESKLISAEGHNAFSPEIESYRLIRTNIQFASIDNPIKSFLLTSANPGEGKSTTAANLSVVMAQADYKTIIVDADLRRPTLHKVFQLPNLGGLTDLLFASDDELDIEAYLKNTGVDNLSVITSGSLPPNASEILGSKRMKALLEKLEEMADVVIFDTPPVLPVTDATVLSRWVDGVIMVVRGKSTRRDAARQAVDRLNQVNANWLGAILNFTTAKGERSNKGYSSYYTRGSYGMTNNISGSTNKRRWWQRIPLLNSDRI
jgi:non-specific protein-tyrosine kinase